jgi:hypothetical protein
MSRENPTWGAPEDSWRVAQTRRRDRRDQRQQIYGPFPEATFADVARLLGESPKESGIGGFLHGAPTLRFQILYVFLVLAHDRRRILHFGVTAHPTAQWTALQLRNAFPWDTTPRYLLRDRDRIFGNDFTRQVEEMGIREVLSAPRSPWQRSYVERVIRTALLRAARISTCRPLR